MEQGNSIKVSIIMPSLNVVNYIDEAILSVRNQTLKDIEILCIDAGSTDGTVDIIKRHVEEDSRVKYIHSDRKSYGYQLNIGLQTIKGKYFGIVETDDYVDSNMYDVLFYEAEKEKLDFVKADYKAFFTQDNGEKFFLNRKNFSQSELYGKVLCPKRYPEVAIGDWYNCQGIYNSDFIKENNICFSETPGAAFQDIGFLYFAIIKANRVMYLTDSFYRYRIDREDSSSNSGRGIKYSYDEFSRLFGFVEDIPNIDEDDLRVLYIRMAKSFVSSYGDLRAKKIDLNSEERECYYNWFKEKMQGAIEAEKIVKDDMQKNIWDSLVALIDSEDSLRKLQLKEDATSELMLRIQDDRDARVVIFGCGNYGFDAYKNLRKNNINIVCFTDNNCELWGKKLEGIDICSPNNLNLLDDKLYFVVANELHHQEIKEQLLQMKVNKDKIVIYGRAYS